MNRWVEVKREVPPLDERVLVLVHNIKTEDSSRIVREGYFDGDAWHIADSAAGDQPINSNCVEFWQHFPTPPISNRIFRFIHRILNPFENWFVTLSMLLLFSGCVFLFWSSCNFWGKYKEAKTVSTAMIKQTRVKQAISQTLQITYGLSSYTSDGCAEVFYRASRQYCINWEYFGALIYIESRYNNTVKSGAGACGFAQLLESTAEQTCVTLHIPYKKNLTIWNPFVNLELGCRYFYEGKLTKGAPKSMDDVIRHYNPKAVDEEYLIPFTKEYNKISYIYRGVCKDLGL